MYSSFVHTPYVHRLVAALCINGSCAYFAARFVPRREAGWPRASAALPILLLNSLLPALFHDLDEVLTKGLFLICLFWICNFRVLALCLDRGPLVRQRSLSHFFAVYMLPIDPCDNEPSRYTESVGCYFCRYLWFRAVSSCMLLLCKPRSRKRARLQKLNPLVNPAALLATQDILSSTS